MADAPHSIYTRFDPVTLLIGWLWPGFGYRWIGQPRRGWLVMAGVLSLFFFGPLVGGVDVVDRKEDWLWFLPQALIGPLAFAADYLNATFVKSGRIGTPSVGSVNDYGTLFVALAGLMNFAAMIDAAARDKSTEMDLAPPTHRRATDQQEAK